MWFADKLAEPQVVGDPGRAQFITAFNAGLNWREVIRTFKIESPSSPDENRGANPGPIDPQTPREAS